MSDPTDIAALADAFEAFTKTTQSMEEVYHRLEQRSAELNRELEQKVRELALTTDYLSNLLESMSDGVIAVDTRGRITRFNRAASIVLGYPSDDVIGLDFEQVFSRTFSASDRPGETELHAQSGRKVPVNERDSAISDHAGRCLGRVKTFQDLSELIALREQVRQMDRLAAIGEMAATVAHEIRNPLGGIRGFAEFLARDIPEEDPRRRLVDKILAGAQSLGKVVNELLEYTRPVELSLSPTCCAVVAAAALRYVQYDGNRISILIQIDPALKVLADADQLKQVLLNMLLNAVQSIGAEGEIHVSAHADENDVDFVIRDTGCGMNAEQLGKLFSPFFTTKEKGTGLGLAVCMKIVEGHGGEIRAQSVESAGTTMTIRLPRCE